MISKYLLNKYLLSLFLSPSLLFSVIIIIWIFAAEDQQQISSLFFIQVLRDSRSIWIMFQTPVIQWALKCSANHCLACWYNARRRFSSSYSFVLFSSSSAFFFRLWEEHSRGCSWIFFVFVGCPTSDATLHFVDRATRLIEPTWRCAWSASDKWFLDRIFISVQFYRMTFLILVNCKWLAAWFEFPMREILDCSNLNILGIPTSKFIITKFSSILISTRNSRCHIACCILCIYTELPFIANTPKLVISKNEKRSQIAENFSFHIIGSKQWSRGRTAQRAQRNALVLWHIVQMHDARF